jgi:oxygen-independent coproporphyrinogen-3 oxidase
MPDSNAPVGVYVHLPFCHSKCTYCGFATGSYEADLATAYLAALEREIRAFAGENAPRVADTLYLGGGTPSILSPDQIARIVAACRETFALTPDAEITMEVNPGDAQPERLAAFRALGVNRVSLGVQSFLDRELRATGRDHDAEQSRRAVFALRAAGFDNVSLDLIAGLPKQTLDDWTDNLAQAFALAPEHLSLYLLEVKEGTKLAAQLATGAAPPLDDDLAAEMYERLLDSAAAHGLEAYEISNFARAGRRSRHNLKYWTERPFFGFGVSAHSYDGEERAWNVADIRGYVARVNQTGSGADGRTQRTPHERWHEALMMGLRLREGVSLAALREKYGAEIARDYAAEIERLVEADAIVIEDGVMRLTRRGLLVSNEVFLAFL